MFARPVALHKALDLLREDEWTILAGGTDFYPSLRGQPPRQPVLDITAIDGLAQITTTDDEYCIGALVTWTTLANANLPPAFRALQQSALEVGSLQIQNRATVAGNLCNASPAADGVPPLLCLDASVELSSHAGTRRVLLSDFIHGNRRTARSHDELVSAIIVPRLACEGNSEFIKLGARRYLVISIAMVAVRIVANQNTIQQIAVAVGSCSEVARRLAAVEQALTGAQIDGDLASRINEKHLADINPIDDIRASAEYRHHAALQLVQRTIVQSINNVGPIGALT